MRRARAVPSVVGLNMRYDAPRVRTSQPIAPRTYARQPKMPKAAGHRPRHFAACAPGARWRQSRAMLATFGALAPVFPS
jgi:hypothetical protein